MCSCHVYALKLETAFRRGDCRPFIADEFEVEFQGTLALGLSRLSAENLIEKSEINAWTEEYVFGGKKLREIVTDDENGQKTSVFSSLPPSGEVVNLEFRGSTKNAPPPTKAEGQGKAD